MTVKQVIKRTVNVDVVDIEGIKTYVRINPQNPLPFLIGIRKVKGIKCECEGMLTLFI